MLDLPGHIPRNPYTLARQVTFTNNAVSTCPAFGCLQITSVTMLANVGPVYQCQQPDGMAADLGFLFNLGASVGAGKNGAATLDFPCQALYNTGSPTTNQLYGPTASQWYLTAGNQPGYVVLGVTVSANKQMMIGMRPSGGGTLFADAVLSQTMTNSDTAGISVSSITPWDGSADSSSTIANPRGHSAANGATVTVAKKTSGASPVWIVVDCPLTDVTFVKGISGSNFTTQQIACEVDGTAGTTSLPTTAITVQVSTQWSSPNLTYTTQVINVIGSAGATTAGNAINTADACP